MSHWVSAEIAASYRAFRPRYPEKLFERVAQIYQVSASASPKQAGAIKSSPSLILDVGTGSGQAIEGLLRVFPVENGTRYIGLDPSEAQLHEARKEFEKIKNHVTFVQGDAGSNEPAHLEAKIRSSVG